MKFYIRLYVYPLYIRNFECHFYYESIQVSSLPLRNQTLAIAVKKHAKVDIKAF